MKVIADKLAIDLQASYEEQRNADPYLINDHGINPYDKLNLDELYLVREFMDIWEELIQKYKNKEEDN